MVNHNSAEFKLLLKKLKTRIGFEFEKIDFRQVFVHKSILNENDELNESNERLEFLGDAVLEIVVTEYLFLNYPDYSEGELSNIRTNSVRQEFLHKIAKNLGLEDLLIMGAGEVKSGGNENPAILENTVEALFGAIYLEHGIKGARKLFKAEFIKYLPKKPRKDPKAALQEFTQEKLKITPHYKLEKEIIQKSESIYHMGVYLESRKVSTGKGKRKKDAEEKAAEKALKVLRKEL